MKNKLLYEIFHDENAPLFTKKFWHILLQSMRRVDCDPSIKYFMDTEDWYEALNAFDANDKETLQKLAVKHVERYMTEKRVAPAPKYLSDGETVWELTK